jgi:hypothetical protein
LKEIHSSGYQYINGIIYFTLDGFISDENGIAFNPEEKSPMLVRRWYKITDHWYEWGT